MSITLQSRKDSLTHDLKTQSQFVNATVLKKLLSHYLHIQINLIRLFHINIDKEYGQHEVIRQGQKVAYQIKNTNQQHKQIRKKGIIYADELEKIIQNSKIIIIKSANQENIQKSKDLSIWATTFSNQQRLKYFYNNSKHVLFIFATNRSYEIKGLARMESQPDKLTDKTVWAGVANIRLGGNFKIKWLRKKPLSLVHIEKSLGANFKDTIIKSCDGQELDPLVCKKLAYLFDTPEESYYPNQEKQIKQKQNLIQTEKKPLQLQSMKYFLPCPPPILIQSMQNIFPITQTNKISSSRKDISSSQNQQSQSVEKKRKIKKEKKNKKKSKNKNKKHKKQKKSEKKKKRKYSDSQSSSDENISEQSNDPSNSSSRSDIKKKKKKLKKQRKFKK